MLSNKLLAQQNQHARIASDLRISVEVLLFLFPQDLFPQGLFPQGLC